MELVTTEVHISPERLQLLPGNYIEASDPLKGFKLQIVGVPSFSFRNMYLVGYGHMNELVKAIQKF